jgi:phosphoglycolate phosphatase
MIKGLLFDKDGTLFDFQATWSGWAAGLLTHVASGDEALLSKLAGRLLFDMKGRRFLPGSPIIASTSKELAQIIHPMLPGWALSDLTAHMVETAAHASLVEVLPLQPLFEQFAGLGVKIGLATNDGEVAARAHLKRAGITRYFDMILGFDSGFGGKPAPGQCLAFAEAMDLPPDEIAMIGDSLHDLDAGRAAGMVTIGVLSGPASRADLEPHADVVLNDIGELPDWLLAHG